MKRIIVFLTTALFLTGSFIANSAEEGINAEYLNTSYIIKDTEKIFDINPLINNQSYSVPPISMLKLSDAEPAKITTGLTSKLEDAVPYYAAWQIGKDQKLSYIISVIQVSEKEIPEGAFKQSGGMPYRDPYQKYTYYKIVLDKNRNLDFTDDDTGYVAAQGYGGIMNAAASTSVNLPYYYDSQNKNIDYPVNFSLQFQPDYSSMPRDGGVYNPSYSLLKSDKYKCNVSIMLRQPIINEGRAIFDGAEFKFGLIDSNCNGFWDGEDILMVDMNKDNAFEFSSRFTNEKYKVSDTFNYSGTNYVISNINILTGKAGISKSTIVVEEKKLFDIGSPIPAFVRKDILTRKTINNIDLKDKPFIMFFHENNQPDQTVESANVLISMIEKYIGKNKVKVIIFVNNFYGTQLLDLIPPGETKYYLLNAKVQDRNSGEKNILEQFGIDPYSGGQIMPILIAADRDGKTIYYKKSAVQDNFPEVCTAINESLGKKGGNKSGFFGLFKSENSSKSEYMGAEKEILKYPAAVNSSVKWFDDNKSVIQQALKQNSIFFQETQPQFKVTIQPTENNEKLQIPQGEIKSHFPRFSSDKKSLFIKLNDVEKKTYLLEIPESKPSRVLYESNDRFSYYDVSPDKSSIVYDIKEPNSKFSQIYIIDLKTGDKKLGNDPATGGIFPSYSPDGKSLAYCAQKKIHIRNLKTDEEKLLCDDGTTKEFPQWSPDGKWIVYQGSSGDEYAYDIFKVKIDTGEKIQLVKEKGIDANPSFINDGKEVIFISERNLDQPGKSDIWKMSADGSDQQKLLSTERSVYWPKQ